MSEFLVVLLFVVGIVLIVKGGDYFVDAASWIAEVSKIPKLIIGATIVSIATTLPELLVSIMAAVQGKTDMAVGNAVGSVTANVGLILAIALIFMAGPINRKDYLLKSILMLLASLIVACCGFAGEVNILLSILLLLIFITFMVDNVISAKKSVSLEDDTPVKKDKKTVIINVLKFVVGAVAIVWGADLLVDNGSEIARWIGVSERIIGVTIVAVGTSLPELVTTITAIVKKQSALSAGNIIGANVIDLTLIMPLCALVSGSALPIASTAVVDLVSCLAVGTLALVPALIMKKFSKWQGYALLGVYIAYVIMTCTM
ncbi:MAG: calcium/sodium antiporter [Clostridia bacterium]|nr:calcium/sodium antiporter [Clostridia bacterium]